MIRLMTLDDVDVVADIEKECFSEPWNAKGFADALRSEDNIFIVCQNEKGYILGYVGLYGAFDEGEITNVAVRTEARKMGIGHLLMEDIISRAKKRGITRMFLEVRVSNTPAIKLYEKMDFESCGIRKNFYRNPSEDGFVMVKNID